MQPDYIMIPRVGSAEIIADEHCGIDASALAAYLRRHGYNVTGDGYPLHVQHNDDLDLSSHIDQYIADIDSAVAILRGVYGDGPTQVELRKRDVGVFAKLLVMRGIDVHRADDELTIAYPYDRSALIDALDHYISIHRPRRPCGSCLGHIGRHKCCPDCGRRLNILEIPAADLIESIRNRIAVVGRVITYGDSIKHFNTRWSQYKAQTYCSSVAYELEHPRLAAFMRGPGAAIDGANNGCIMLNGGDADLTALAARLERPIFVFGVAGQNGNHIIMTADELEKHFPGLKRLADIRGTWLHDAMIIQPSYPNIRCLVQALCLLESWLDSA